MLTAAKSFEKKHYRLDSEMHLNFIKLCRCAKVRNLSFEVAHQNTISTVEYQEPARIRISLTKIFGSFSFDLSDRRPQDNDLQFPTDQ